MYAMLGAIGYVIYGFGPVVALLRDEQHTSRGVASLHSTAFAVGILIGGAVTPRVVRRHGRPTSIWLGLTGTTAAVAALCLARPLPATLVAALGIGGFATLMLAGIVSGLGQLHGRGAPAAISEANAAACGIGAVAPLIIGSAVGAGLGWRWGLAVALGLFAVVATVALLLGVRFPAAVAASSEAPPSGRLPRPYWLVFLVMSVCGSVEVCVNLWAADLMRARAGMDAGQAAAAVSAVVAGMFVGRALGARLALRFRPTSVLLGALAVSALGFTVFWLATVPLLGVLGLVVIGLGNALHYPLAISIAMDASAGQPDLAASRSAYAMAFSFGVAPFLLGGLADLAGVRLAFLMVPAMLAIAVFVVWRLRRLPHLASGQDALAQAAGAPTVAGSASARAA